MYILILTFIFTLSLYYDLFIFLLKSAIIYLNEEGRGRSAHGWSSQMRVGSLSRIGCKAEKQGTLQKK